MIKVLLVDDHKMVIEGLKLMLDSVQHIQVVGFAQNGRQALEKAAELFPDIVLLDINMPELNGIDTCKIFRDNYPEIKVIAISMHQESGLIKMMLQNGAKGYVLKNAGLDELIEAIDTVYSGKSYLDETVNEIVIRSLQSSGKGKTVKNPFPSLSRREKEILDLILKEYTTQEIADKLFISFGTVETHRRNMLIKTGARNTAGLVRIALEFGMLDED